MTNAVQSAAIFGASGGLGRAFVGELAERGWQVTSASRNGAPVTGAAQAVRFDLFDEASIAAACAAMPVPDLAIVATGALVLPSGRGPEKTLRDLDPAALGEAFAINTIGPAMIAKHLLPRLPRDRRSVFAVLGARVGSIGDNRLGGWHGYRASKAALAMMIRNIAIEMARTHPLAVIAAIHPGTVDTPLSRPFQRNLPDGQLLDPAASARACLDVLGGLGPQDSGKVFDFRGNIVPA